MADTEFDIIVYGATGYTGRLVAEHFVREYGNAANAPKWAMRLGACRTGAGATRPAAKQPTPVSCVG